MKIIENVLPAEQADLLEKTILSKEFQWSVISDSSGPHFQSKYPSLSKPLFVDRPNGTWMDKQWFTRFEPFFVTMVEKSGCKKQSLSRIRLGAYLPLRCDKHHNPHVDIAAQHTVALYYVNDSDGDTYFFANDRTTVVAQNTPKKNTMIIFDGSTYHASSSPSAGVRVSLNMNFHGLQL